MKQYYYILLSYENKSIFIFDNDKEYIDTYKKTLSKYYKDILKNKYKTENITKFINEGYFTYDYTFNMDFSGAKECCTNETI